MITFFNRSEVLITTDMDLYANARDNLKNAGIEYRTVVKTATSRKIAVQNIHLHTVPVYQYYLYVHTKDYDRAKARINMK